MVSVKKVFFEVVNEFQNTQKKIVDGMSSQSNYQGYILGKTQAVLFIIFIAA